jgi:hypothetical protein
LYIDLAVLWSPTKDFFSSNFFITIASSCAGAFFGAYGAQRMVARGKERDELLTEIRNTSAATVVAFAICNTFLTLKQQYIKPLKDTFDAQNVAFHEYTETYRRGDLPCGTPFHFTADLGMLFLSPFPIDTLRQLVFEKISLDERRPLMLVTALVDAIHGLNSSTDNRNTLIEFYKFSNISSDDLVPLYFGFPHISRVTSREYPDLIAAISRHTDDGIFLSKLLCTDLFEHNRQLVERFKRRFGKSAPGFIDKPDFTKAENSNLMPNDADYADWFNLFVKSKRAGSPHAPRNSISCVFSTACRRAKSRIRRNTESPAKSP